MSQPKLLPKLRVTVEDYLRMERAAEERHTYCDGVITAMAGESLSHGRISVNLVMVTGMHLRGHPCEALTKDTKIRSGRPGPWNPRATAGLFSYPDIVIVCGPIEFHDDHKDVITNPTAIIEVLSPSTELFDRGKKFERYHQWNPTLRDYLLVHQDQPHIELFTRQPESKWLFSRILGMESTVEIPSIGCVLKLADVYDRVELPKEEPGEEA